MSRLRVLKSLEVGDWAAELKAPGARHTIVMGVFSTITSPVFSELVIVLWFGQPARVFFDDTFLETLRMMSELRSFRLVFLLHEWSQFGCYWEERRIFERDLESMTAEGLFDFLHSPPTIRVELLSR